MKSLKELFNESGSWSGVSEKASNRLIERGYIYSPVFGWEKPETLTSFQLDPNMEGIPSETRFDNDLGHNCKGANAQWLKFHNYKKEKSMADYANFKEGQRLESCENY